MHMIFFAINRARRKFSRNARDQYVNSSVSYSFLMTWKKGPEFISSQRYAKELLT